MSTELAVRNLLMKSCDGIWYSVPESMEAEFKRLNEVVQGTDVATDEWFDAMSEFDEVFEPFARKDGEEE